MKSILKPRAAQGKYVYAIIKNSSGNPNKMTAEDHAEDFKYLLAAHDIPDLAATPAISSAPTSSPSPLSSSSSRPSTNCDSLVSNKATMALDEQLELEAKNDVQENGVSVASVDSGHPVENGEHHTDSKNHSTSVEAADWNITAKKQKLSAGQTKRIIKLARVRRKSSGCRRGNGKEPILAPKLVGEKPNSTSASLSALSTTDTMIKSIPDLFKKASIATEGSSNLPNGPMNGIPSFRESSTCNETAYHDVIYQISVNALPPFEPLEAPPERFDLKIPSDGYRCLDCNDHFLVESSLTQHLQRRSVCITFSCSSCKKLLVFYNRCTLLGHIRTHHDRSQTSDIRQAMVSPLPRELIPCIQEQISTSPKLGLSPGVSLVMPTNSGGSNGKSNLKNQKDKCKCPECKQQCESFASLQDHFGGGRTSLSESETRCTKCNMICPSLCSLKAHERIHLQAKPFVCPECGLDLSKSWQDFQHHLVVECMHYSRTVGFRCSSCSALFLALEQLRHHVLNSHSEAYYKCQACPMAFRAESTFDAHRKAVHFFDNLQCSTIRKCPLCEVVFQNQDVLQNHLEDHFQEVSRTSRFVFSCTECGQLFDSKIPLSYHCQTRHPNLPSTLAPKTSENSSNKKQLKLPKKRTHSIHEQGGKLPCLAFKKVKSSPKVITESVKPVESSEKPRIVLSLKGHKSSGDTSEYVIKKVKLPPSHSSNYSATKTVVNCEDCGRTFQSHIGLRVHCQRSHPESYPCFKASMTKASNEDVTRSSSPSAIDSEPPILTKEPQISKLDVLQLRSAKERRSSSNVGLNTCGECGREFQTVHGCNVHRQRCHGPDNVKSKCAVCQEYLPDPHLMAEHGHRHLDEGTLVCTLCNNLAFSTKLALARHIENHVANMKYPLDCFFCGEKLEEAESASAHWKREHHLLSFQCSKCDCRYLYKKSLHRHLHNAHGEGSKGKMHQCRFCEGEFTKMSLLKKHMEDRHHIPEEEPDDPPPVLEPQLPEERPVSPKKESLTETKAEVVTVEKRPEKSTSPKLEKLNLDAPGEAFVCAKCDFRADQRDAFLSHIIVHKTESDSFQCLECGTCFVVEPSLRKHLTCTHKVKDLDRFLTENGYSIGSVTNKEGGSPSEDAKHLHNGNGSGAACESGANPLECTVCFAVLDNALSLKTHMRTHGMAFIRSKRNMICHNNESQQDQRSSSTLTKNDD